MLSPDFILLYVEDPLKSSAFYADLLGIEPCELHPTFAMHPLPGGLKLGLWKVTGVEPPFKGQVGGFEIAFMEKEIDATYEKLKAKGLTIAQVPTDMDFGRTFLIVDPDGHRIRLFWPSEA